MTDKNLVLNRRPFTDKGMGRDLASTPNNSVLLDFDERPDLGFIPDATPVEIN
jgi:hypothetical protein